MKTERLESRLERLRNELERELRLLEVLTDPDEPTGHLTRQQRKAGVGRILLELGTLQMRLLEAEQR